MSSKNILKENDYRELGFGDKVVEQNQRLMRSDGRSNVNRRGLGLLMSLNIFHRLITMSWLRFNTIVLSAYITVNFLFACIYYFIGNNGLSGMIYQTEFEKFMESFFFSAQTLSTVGYGRISPTGLFTSSVAAIETFIGLLGFAMATGLLYGRFSRPVAKLIFSKNILISPYKEGKALMFRLGNIRKSELIDCEVNVTLAHVQNVGGKLVRKFATLKLEITKINFLSMSWTIVHPIDDESPLSNWSLNDINEKQIEVLILFKGYEETFAQTVHTRHSYFFNELINGAKFNPITLPADNGSVIVELNRINEHQLVTLN